MGLNLASQYFLRYAAAIFSLGNIELWKVNKLNCHLPHPLAAGWLIGPLL